MDLAEIALPQLSITRCSSSLGQRYGEHRDLGEAKITRSDGRSRTAAYGGSAVTAHLLLSTFGEFSVESRTDPGEI